MLEDEGKEAVRPAGSIPNGAQGFLDVVGGDDQDVDRGFIWLGRWRDGGLDDVGGVWARVQVTNEVVGFRGVEDGGFGCAPVLALLTE